MRLRALCIIGFSANFLVGCPPGRQAREETQLEAGLQIDSTPTPTPRALVDVHLLMNKSSAEIEQLLGKPIHVGYGHRDWEGCTEKNDCKEVWYAEKYRIHYLPTVNGQRAFMVDYERPLPLEKESLSLIGVPPVEPTEVDTTGGTTVFKWSNIPNFDEIRLQKGTGFSVKRRPK